MSRRAEKRDQFLKKMQAIGRATITKQEIDAICQEMGISCAPWFTNDASNRVSRGLYRVPGTIDMNAKVISLEKKVDKSDKKIKNVTTDLEETNLVPKEYDNYIPFGNYSDVLAIVKSKRFFPIFITGHSGNGKTMSIEQACAKAKREFVCISMTPETDESDLLGNYVLIDGNMEWRDGPVTVAARRGAVLCIDEIDYGAQNLSCLQRVLEGKPFMLKKKGELITPAEGFTIFATANTKGKGSEDGRYMFTNILNEAFLERFRNTLEQDWPSIAIEKKIITKELESVNHKDDEFAENLVNWADAIRKTFADGGCDEVISTRRLVHIVETYGIFGERMKAIELCLNRFDIDTKTSFMDLYTKIDIKTKVPEQPQSINPEHGDVGKEIQF